MPGPAPHLRQGAKPAHPTAARHAHPQKKMPWRSAQGLWPSQARGCRLVPTLLLPGGDTGKESANTAATAVCSLSRSYIPESLALLRRVSQCLALTDCHLQHCHWGPATKARSPEGPTSTTSCCILGNAVSAFPKRNFQWAGDQVTKHDTIWDISHPSLYCNAGWINPWSGTGQPGRWRTEAASCNKVLCPYDNTIVPESNESSKNAQRKRTISTSTHLVPKADQIKPSQIKTPIDRNPPCRCPCQEDLPWSSLSSGYEIFGAHKHPTVLGAAE